MKIEMKSCGTCKECCKGALKIEVPGCVVHNGNHCPYLTGEGSKGCSIYASRPKKCADFYCWWINDESAPDDMRPDKLNIIAVIREKLGFTYIDAVATSGNELSVEELSRLIMHVMKTKQNLIWRQNAYDQYSQAFFIGSPEFMRFAEMVNEKLTTLKQIDTSKEHLG